MKPMMVLKTGGTTERARTQWGDFEDWMIRAGGMNPDETVVVDAVQVQTLPDYRDFAGIVITGSHAMVTDREPWSERAARWLKGAVEAGIPVLGVCYGHQLLAHALGGVVHNHPDGSENGTVSIRLTGHCGSDPIFKDLPSGFSVHASHTQSVSKLPEGAVLLAYNSYEPHHGFRIGSCCWGVQFHPEFTPEPMKYYLEKQRSSFVARGLDVDQMISNVKDCPWGTEVLRRFVRFAQK